VKVTCKQNRSLSSDVKLSSTYTDSEACYYLENKKNEFNLFLPFCTSV